MFISFFYSNSSAKDVLIVKKKVSFPKNSDKITQNELRVQFIR